MKKTFMLSFTLLFLMGFGSSFAQTGELDLNLGVDLGLPMGDFGDAANFGFGATAKGLYGISDQGQIELTVGYLSFSGKGVDTPFGSVKTSYGIIPVMLGYRHHFDQFYVEPQLGLAMVSSKTKTDMETPDFPDIPGMPDLGDIGGSSSHSESSSEFSWAL